MRDKARSLPALAAAAALLGSAAGLGIAATWPSSGPSGAGRSAGLRADAGATSVIPLLGSTHLTSLSLPVAPAPNGGAVTVAPLQGLRQAAMIIVAPASLPSGTLAAIRRLPGVTDAQAVEAAKIEVNGKYTAVLGVDPSTFRGYAAQKTAASDQLWQSVAGGAMAVSYTMGKLDKLPLGGLVHVAGAKRENLPVGGFGTVGIQGVDAVVSDSVARTLGMPAQNAIVISAPHANLAALAKAAKRVIPHNAGVEPLMTQVTAGSHHDRGERGRRGLGRDLGRSPRQHRRGSRPGHDLRHAERRAQQARHAVHMGRGRAGLVRLLGPGPVVVRAGRCADAARRRRPGPDRARGAGQPASAR